VDPNPILFEMSGFDITVAAMRATTGFNGLMNLFFGGADTFYGSPFADIFFGLGGNDILEGNGGADRLTGGLGRDTMNGGAAADVFIFNAAAESAGANADTIQGFSHLQHDQDRPRYDHATAGGINNVFLFAGHKLSRRSMPLHNGGAVRALPGGARSISTQQHRRHDHQDAGGHACTRQISFCSVIDDSPTARGSRREAPGRVACRGLSPFQLGSRIVAPVAQ